MCRSTAEGGRCCTGGHASSPQRASSPAPSAPTAADRKRATREARRDRYARAFEAFRAAEQTVNGGVIGSVAPILTSAVSRHAESGRHADAVTEARALVRGVLTGRGMSRDEADTAIARLESTYTAWRATPER
jgi:hypothetical protein